MFDILKIEHFQTIIRSGIMMHERQKKILSILDEKERVSVSVLAKTLYVSEMTIRRDLKALEQDGLLRRYNGGAIKVSDNTVVPISERKLFCSEEKTSLAKQAEQFIHDDMSVFIDSSSTCMYIIPIIAKYKNMRIITNSIQNLLLAAHYHIPCFISGGNYYERDMCTTGKTTESNLRDMNVDIAFCTSLGISEDGIISDNDEQQLSIRKAIMKNSKKNVFLFVNNKKGQKYLYTLCHADDVDYIIM